MLGTPSAVVGNSFASKTLGALKSDREWTLVITNPADTMKEWPVVGEKIHAVRYEASDDLPQFVEERQPQIKSFLDWHVGAAGGTAKSVFLLTGAIIVAGIMLAWAKPAAKSIRKIFIRFWGTDHDFQIVVCPLFLSSIS